MEDTLRALVLLAVALALPFGLLIGVSQLLRRVTRARDAKLADGLIAAKGAKSVNGMETTDWRLVDRAGERRWQDALRGQRRTRKPSDPAHVVEFRGRGR